ncbi:carotenoid-cleaving dioxygenase, mitochondrial-like [Mercenaria mercenaria]|uniref:carotenoid-cleaving dioxygenase, mitochondrial-like n=1 Tax=Mercenaria mercenaria TaxID=6596 RepID=UPI00234F646E|nr:carotenoid-cleaving dioxygenase, mitochondrial-like [Mercenaria mercenaria]
MSDSPIVFDKPLPPWLRGSLIRNGIGRFEMGSRHVTTALDAYAKLSKWTFTNNSLTQTARFSTKFVQSDSYKKSVAAGDIMPYMMLAATDPPFAPWQTMESMFYGADNMNVNVFNYGGSGNNSEGYVITSDFWNSYGIDPHTLGTLKPIKPPVPGAPTYDKMIVLGCSHSLPEHGTSNHITFVSLASAIPGLKSKYVFYRATSDEGREKIAEIEVDKISYIHSFALTKNYMILVASPLFIDPTRIFRTLSPEDAMAWEPNTGVQFHTVNLKTGFVDTFVTENFFFLHHINSFENEFGELAIDLVTYKNGNAMAIMDLKNLINATTRSMFKPPLIKRYTLNMQRRTININTFDNLTPNLPYAATLDFPTINENYRFEKYCYVYGVVYAVNGSDFLDMALVKKDLCTGKTDKAWYKKGSYFNEAFFVPRPGGKEEDDGVLLVDILDTVTKESAMVIFDAKTLQISNSALLPTNNPFGTHGRFFPDIV